MNDTTLLEFVLFTFTFWLGGYLIVRNPTKLGMHLAGWGLIAYALTVALNALTRAELSPWVLVQRVLGLLPAGLWTVSIVLLLRRNGDLPSHRPFGLLVVGGIFFALSMVSFIANLFPPFWVLASIGFDVGLLGFAAARLDAFDEGESFAPEFVRSLLGSGVMAFTFGCVVALAALASGGWTLPLRALAFAVLALAIDVQLFAPRLQTLLDRFVLPTRVQQQRAELRETVEELVRADDALDLTTLDEVEFARLTRRALSHLTDLPKLAASPLTRLPLVNRHLIDHGMSATPLDRAVALRAVLAARIDKLKPDGGSFGTSDAWRHYNALHFTYVVGLKPYSARTTLNGHEADESTKAALAWFQVSVPERTLHNWQNAAAKVIAQELRAPAQSERG